MLFQKGHKINLGRKQTEETRKKISEKNKGRKLSEEQKKRSVECFKEYYKNNKHPLLGKHLSEETKRKIGLANSIALKGNIPWSKGLTDLYKHTEEWKKKMSETKKRLYKNGNIKLKEYYQRQKNNPSQNELNRRKKISLFLKGNKYSLGKHLTEETKKKLSLAHKGHITSEETKRKIGLSNSISQKGEKSSLWKGGISFEPYGLEFNNQLREQIRKRDNYTCQECKHIQKQLGYKLHIHHIDFNKKNNSPNNLISLCRNCHAQTNFNRDNWTTYFQNKINMEI